MELLDEIRDNPDFARAELGDAVTHLEAAAPRLLQRLRETPPLADALRVELTDDLAVNRLHAAAAEIEVSSAQLGQLIALLRLTDALRPRA